MTQIKIIITTMLLLTGCAYKPVIDTAGRSGTYNDDRAREITNDMQHCEKIADDNVNRAWDTWQQAVNMYASSVTLGLIPKKESEYRSVIRDCLRGRGHSVIR